MKYKALIYGPGIRNSGNVDFVDRIEFLTEDGRIPLLVYNYQIYPEEFKTLKLLEGRWIALMHIGYLSGRESEIREYYLNEENIKLLTDRKSLMQLERGKAIF
jgi:hypothetical protein